MEISVGTYEGTLYFFYTDLNQIKPIKSLQISENSIKSVCSIGGNYLIAGGHDQELRVVDLSNHQQKVEAKQNVGQITKIACINDRLFVVGVDDGTIRLWNSQNWSIVSSARFHKKCVNSLSVCKEGKLLISSAGNKIILWAAQTLKKAHQYKFSNQMVIENIKLSADMKSIYFSNSSSEIYRVSTENNEQKLLIKMPIPRKVQEFILYNNFIIIANDVGEILAWQLDENQQASLEYEKKIWFKAHEARIKEIKIVADSYLIVVTAAGDVSVWDFPQFLKQVDHISQNYQLEGLKPLCSTKIKGRILCVDAIIKQQKKQPRKKSESADQEVMNKQVQKQENQNEAEILRKKKKKTKPIQKQQKGNNKKAQIKGHKQNK